MEWGNPQAIFWFLIIVVFIGIWIFSDKIKRLLFYRLGEFDNVFSSLIRFSASLVLYKRLALVLACVLIILGLMEPRRQVGMRLVKKRVLNIMICLDVSLSMNAEDLKPNRLTRAKIEISNLVKRLQGDRIGLIVFAGGAFVQCPLTTDYSAFDAFLSSVSIDSVPSPGTDIAAALELAIKALSGADGTKAIMLISDGEAFDKDRVIQMARRCKKGGIKIYAVGIGTDKGEPIPLPGGGYKKDRLGNVVLTSLDEQLLMKLAQLTSGAYIRSGATSLDIDRIYRIISSAHRKMAKEEHIPYYEQYYIYLVSLSIFLLLFAWFFPYRRLGIGGWISKDSVTRVLLIVLAFCFVGWKWIYMDLNKAVKAYKKKEVEKAESIFRQLRHKDEDDPIVNYNFGNLLFSKKEDPEKFYQIASLAKDKDIKKKALYNLGNYYMKSGKLKDAIEQYKQALLVDPSFTDARYNLELALKRLDRQKKNQRESRQQASQNKGQAPSSSNKGSGTDEDKVQLGQDSSNPSSQRRQNSSNMGSDAGKGEKEKDITGSKNQTSLIEKESGENKSNKDQAEAKNRGKNEDNLQKAGTSMYNKYDSGAGESGKNKEKGTSAIQGQASQQGSGRDNVYGEVSAVLGALDSEELSPSQVNRRPQMLEGKGKTDKDW